MCHTLCQVLLGFEGAHSLVRRERERAIPILPEARYSEGISQVLRKHEGATTQLERPEKAPRRS